jgi:hypothetical protein
VEAHALHPDVIVLEQEGSGFTFVYAGEVFEKKKAAMDLVGCRMYGARKAKRRKARSSLMKYTSILVLALTLSAASIHAQQSHKPPDNLKCSKGCPVQMSFSGMLTAVPGITFQGVVPGTIATPLELTAAGNGDSLLGPFTVHDLRATSLPKTPPAGVCQNQFYFEFVVLFGVFRFDDASSGSLLTTQLMNGYECVNPSDKTATVNLTVQITGGSGRFAKASGMLNFTSAPAKALAFTPNGPPDAVLIAVPSVAVSGMLFVPDQPSQQ